MTFRVALGETPTFTSALSQPSGQTQRRRDNTKNKICGFEGAGGRKENRPKRFFCGENVTTLKFWKCKFYSREILLSGGGRKGNHPKHYFSWGKRHDNTILKVQIWLSRKFVVIAQAPTDLTHVMKSCMELLIAEWREELRIEFRYSDDVTAWQ